MSSEPKSRVERTVGRAAARSPLGQRRTALLASEIAASAIVVAVVLGGGMTGLVPGLAFIGAGILLTLSYLVIWGETMTYASRWILARHWSDGPKVAAAIVAFAAFSFLPFLLVIVIVATSRP